VAQPLADVTRVILSARLTLNDSTSIENWLTPRLIPLSQVIKYRGGGRNLKRGWVFSFSGALSCLSAYRWQFFYGLLAQRTCRDADRSQPLNALSRPAADDRRTASSYTYWATWDNGMSLYTTVTRLFSVKDEYCRKFPARELFVKYFGIFADNVRSLAALGSNHAS